MTTIIVKWGKDNDDGSYGDIQPLIEPDMLKKQKLNIL
jgi:hypothetical protein